MQASRRKARLNFIRRKTVVNNYALSILVLRSQNYLLKELTSITSHSLTVTDPQRNKIHFDITNQNITITHPSVSTNHVRVHAAQDREHDCYNSFILCRGCTHYPCVVIILG
jgi:hypothetical protein